MSTFFELSNLHRFCQNNPHSIAFAFLASRLLEEDQVEEALQVAERGISHHPTYAFGHYVLGVCHHRMNDFAKAKSHLEKSVAYNDKNPQAWKLMGEINEKLDLPLVAGECNLQYYLLDSFTRDAVLRFQKEDTVQFNEYESDDSLQFDNPFIVDEENALPPGPDREASIEDLFSGDDSITGGTDISQRVEAVFKETLGDISHDLDEEEPTMDNAGGGVGNTLEMVNFLEDDLTDDHGGDGDDFTEDLGEDEDGEATFDNAGGEESLEGLDMLDFSQLEENEIPDPQDDGDETSLNLDNFFNEYGNPSQAEAKQSGETEAEDLGGLNFDDSMADGEEHFSLGNDVDVDPSMDFSSMVEGIIAEQEEDKTATDMEMNFSAPEPEQPDKDDQTANFGRPPILSPTLGEIYIAQGRFEEAIEVFKQLLEKDPGNQRFQKKISDIQGMLARQK
ncbi:MAG: tetratricopeptide repeat protein [Calditrichaeota bacterium]|nr:tetratricopeptide repeat protein [Calditrichota bacterium]